MQFYVHMDHVNHALKKKARVIKIGNISLNKLDFTIYIKISKKLIINQFDRPLDNGLLAILIFNTCMFDLVYGKLKA